MMTEKQKATILSMRKQGIPYADISAITGVPINRAKQFVFRQRHNGQIQRCAQCHKVMANNNRSTKRFCSNGCRSKWWNKHRDQLSTMPAHSHNCIMCGKQFFSFKDAASFCSRPCYYESKRGVKVTHSTQSTLLNEAS